MASALLLGMATGCGESSACLRYSDCDPGLTCAYGSCVLPPVEESDSGATGDDSGFVVGDSSGFVVSDGSGFVVSDGSGFVVGDDSGSTASGTSVDASSTASADAPAE
jgi:hypothetical protein